MTFSLTITLPISGKDILVTDMDNVNQVLGMLRGEDNQNPVAKQFATCVIRGYLLDFSYGLILYPNELYTSMKFNGVEYFATVFLSYIRRENTAHYASHARDAFTQLKDLATNIEDDILCKRFEDLWSAVYNCSLGLLPSGLYSGKISNSLTNLYICLDEMFEKDGE